MSLTEKVYTHMDYQTLLDAIKKIPRSDIFRGFSVYKVVCPTHMILWHLGKRKKPLYKGFCVLLVSKILTFRELRNLINKGF